MPKIEESFYFSSLKIFFVFFYQNYTVEFDKKDRLRYSLYSNFSKHIVTLLYIYGVSVSLLCLYY